MDEKLSEAILKLVKVHDERGKEIAEALRGIGTELKYLGNGNASTGGMGALEGVGKVLKEGLEQVSDSLSGLGDALRSDRD